MPFYTPVNKVREVAYLIRDTLRTYPSITELWALKLCVKVVVGIKLNKFYNEALVKISCLCFSERNINHPQWHRNHSRASPCSGFHLTTTFMSSTRTKMSPDLKLGQTPISDRIMNGKTCIFYFVWIYVERFYTHLK